MTIYKWCIKRTIRYHKPINEWFENEMGKPYRGKSDYNFKENRFNYLHYPKIGKKVLFNKICEGYVEITIDEFEKFINKKTFLKNNKTVKRNV